MRAALALGTLLVAILAGCGGSGSPAGDRATPATEEADPTPPTKPTTPAPAEPPGPGEPEKPGEPDEPDEPGDTGERSRRGDSSPRESGSGPTDLELEEIVSAWSEALNAGDNEAAADLFAPNAVVRQGNVELRLPDRAGAIRFNSALPCSGSIVELETENNTVTAVFELGDRASNACDVPSGTLAVARFVIEDGLIAVWQQLPPPGQRPDDEPPPGGTLV